MLVTEKDAAAKWCPFVRQVSLVNIGGIESTGQAAASANRDSDYGYSEFAPCIGSRCMAWRTSESYIDKPATGYCGLAGVPREALPKHQHTGPK